MFRTGSETAIGPEVRLTTASWRIAELIWGWNWQALTAVTGQVRKFACAMGFVGIGLTLAPECDFGLPGSLPDDLNYDALSN
jgi:hypothetical protein